jgi:hypothetical protein
MAGMPTFPPQAAGTYNPTAWGSQASVSSPSLSSATTQAGPMSLDNLGTPQLSRFSPCTPLDVPGTYNPNDFSTVDLNATFNPAASFALRRPLFHGGSSHGVLDGMPLGTDTVMADIINGGLPPFYSQDEAEAYTGNDDSQEPWENEAYAYAEEEVPVAKKKKKIGGRGPKWTSREDECLAEAWKSVCIDPFTGANQSSDAYWLRVKAAYDERRLLDPYFKNCCHERNDSAMSHRWHIMQHACNKWHGVVEEVRRVHVSDINFEDQVSELAMSIVHRSLVFTAGH